MFIADVIAIDSDSITLSFWTNEVHRVPLPPDQIELLAAAHARAKANPDALRDYFRAALGRAEALVDLEKEQRANPEG